MVDDVSKPLNLVGRKNRETDMNCDATLFPSLITYIQVHYKFESTPYYSITYVDV